MLEAFPARCVLIHDRVECGLGLGLGVEEQGIILLAPAQVVHRAPGVYGFHLVGVLHIELQQLVVVAGLGLPVALGVGGDAHIQLGHAQEEGRAVLQRTLGHLLHGDLHVEQVGGAHGVVALEAVAVDGAVGDQAVHDVAGDQGLHGHFGVVVVVVELDMGGRTCGRTQRRG